MSLFVLRDGYRVTSTPSGGSVIHEGTGKGLDLSPEEVEVFARATAGGIDARDPQVRAVVRKFAKLGVLVPAPQRASVTPPAVRPASPPEGGASEPAKKEPASKTKILTVPTPPKPGGNDNVRLFRRDLDLNRRQSSALFDITDTKAGKTFPLYDFEVSLARMLDGKRTYNEVVEAGQRLGIPVSLNSLIQFVRQLDAYGFLAPPGTQPTEVRTEGTMWAPREKWDESVRALFQSGLRMHRQGRYAEAANYFEAMLEQDPQNPEALEMLEQTRQRVSGPASGSEQSVLLPPDPNQVTVEELWFADAASGADDLPEPEPQPELGLPGTFDFSAPTSKPRIPTTAPEPKPTEEPLAAAPSPAAVPPSFAPHPSKPRIIASSQTANPDRRSKRWLVPLGVGIASIVVGFGIAAYIRSQLPGPMSSFARRVRRPKNARGGVAGTDAGVASTTRAPIADAGATSLVAGGGSMPQVPRTVEPSHEINVDAGASGGTKPPPVALSASTADAGLSANNRLPGAAAAPAGADAGATSPDAGKKWIAIKIEHRGRVTMAEVKAPATGVISWLAQPQQLVRRGEVIGTVQEKKKSKERPVVTPQDGLLIQKAHQAGKVKKSDRIAAIVYHEAYLQAFFPDVRPEPTWSCEVSDPASGKKASCKLVTVEKRGSRYFVTATTEPMWFDTADKAVLRLAPP